jgi:LacI family transcriptional regulator
MIRHVIQPKQRCTYMTIMRSDRTDKDWPKVELMANEIENEVRNGVYGVSGDRFLTVRKLAANRSISYVTAWKIITYLRERGVIVLYGKTHYIATGIISKDSPLSHSMSTKCGNHKRIGIHLTYIDNPFFTSIVARIQLYLEAKGYQAIISSSQGNSESECAILRSFIELGALGVISFPGYADMLANFYRNYFLPFVFIGRTIGNIEGHAILVDNEIAAYQVANHLIDMGYKHFAYVGLEQFGSAKDIRIEGYAHGLNEKNIMLDARYIVKVNANDVVRASALLKQFIYRLEKPVGVFCFHDLIAAELINICHILSLNIPEEVGIVGFDDLPIAAQLNPQLTTVSYRFDKMAQTAVDLLLSQIEGASTRPSECSNLYIRPMLIVRNSSAKRSI